MCTNCILYIEGNQKLRDFKQINKKKVKISDNEVNKLIEEYDDIAFEDVIAGGLKTKYHYIDVEADGFGLTDAELVFADDNILD